MPHTPQACGKDENQQTATRTTKRTEKIPVCSFQFPQKVASQRSTRLILTLALSLSSLLPKHRLAGLVVKASASGTEDPGFESRLRRHCSGSSHTSDLKIGTPVATLPGAWHYRVSAGTGRPGVSILWLGEMESLISNFCLSVVARKIVCADQSLRYTSMLLGR